MRVPADGATPARGVSRQQLTIAVAVVATLALFIGLGAWALRVRTSPVPATGATTRACSATSTSPLSDTATTAADTTNLTLDTTCGPIVIRLLTREAPTTSQAMMSLASSDGLDGAPCYRLLTQVMYALQCGNTSFDGNFLDVPVENLPPDRPNNYRAGYVALITDSAGTPTDQFFIAYRDFSLPPRFPVWGEVTEGLAIVQAIAAAGVRPGTSNADTSIVAGEPLEPISIVSARAGS
ncbi:MAG: hypothetical protein F2842_00050 [Actinobacteria bacterium]|uniref:Unannotated protein n=1 Tax=freshwater metagenome TaxID=449393 RepID=A0A6J7I8M2_9ZZZZ|nr:hypothetical protein [Actinomycetota bacterium]MSW40581.1 hypothetical protein [Actinomycetota bacterium]